MTARSQTGLWAIAAAGSIAFHLAAGMILYAMPMAEGPKTVRTEISITSVSTGDSQVAAAESVVAVAPQDNAIAARPSEMAALEVESAAPASASPSADARPATQSAEAVAVRAESSPARETADTLVPARAPEAAEALKSAPEVLDAAALAASEAPVPSTLAEAIPAASSASATRPSSAAEAAPVGADELVPSLQTDSPLAVPLPPSEPSASTLHSETEAIASIESETPQLAIGGEAIAPLGGAQAAMPAQAAREPAQGLAPKGEAALAPRPAAGAVSSRPSASLAPAATTAREAVEPTVAHSVEGDEPTVAKAATADRAGVEPTIAPRAADGDAAAFTPSIVADPVATDAPAIVAQLPRPQAPLEIPPSDQPRPPGIAIGTFLKEHKGRDGDCLLALPASAEATQALVEAYAKEPDLVGALGAEYERVAGSKLEADIRRVSQEQCVALIFARSLPKYPNFPLRLTLAEQAIRSGEPLSGSVSGLGKDTLYLVVIDDEGKAELVTSFAEQHTSLITFKRPMTLTSAPVSSVQLLVAIASDGPLRTVPVSPGMPADEYFSRLATEIIGANRSIAFGITSFVVR